MSDDKARELERFSQKFEEIKIKYIPPEKLKKLREREAEQAKE